MKIQTVLTTVIAFCGVIAVLSFAFNLMLNPVEANLKENQVRIEADLKDFKKEVKTDFREVRKDIKDFKKEVNEKLDKILLNQSK